MNMHSPTQMDHQTLDHEKARHEQNNTHAKAGLWKLLVAAAVILLAMVAMIEIFGSSEGNSLIARSPQPPQTIVK